MKLPKAYLSYSAWSLWQKNKKQFREKYYENKKIPTSVEMIFGKKIAVIMENEEQTLKDPLLCMIPRYSEPEFEIITKIEDIPVKGFIDTFDPVYLRFGEYKTGHTSCEGLSPWTEEKVLKHTQLPFYSLLIKTMFGGVTDLCHLHWIETKMKKQTLEFDGHILNSDSKDVELTGKIVTFPRVILEEEREDIKKSIIQVANEISEDYSEYLKTYPQPHLQP